MSQYDLEDRTEQFAMDCRKLVRAINKDIANKEDCKQLTRSSGSVAANYIEANEALSKKDFTFRIKICRKEVKESRLWLKLLKSDQNEINELIHSLVNEATELLKIFSAIILKS